MDTAADSLHPLPSLRTAGDQRKANQFAARRQVSRRVAAATLLPPIAASDGEHREWVSVRECARVRAHVCVSER